MFVGKLEGVAEMFMLHAPAPKDAPVGIVMCLPGQRPDHSWPHVVWFPWATLRNRLESAGRFLNVMRREVKMFVAADSEGRPFFDRIARYGILRRAGTSKEWFGEEDATLFETRKPKVPI